LRWIFRRLPYIPLKGLARKLPPAREALDRFNELAQPRNASNVNTVGRQSPERLCSRMFKVFIDDVLHSKLPLSDCLSEANNGFYGLRLNVWKS
jgi:hypothetical protein